MSGYGSGRRWAGLVALVVLAALGGVVWYLMGGCEEEPQANGQQSGLARRTVATLQTMCDLNILELMLQAGYFAAEHGQVADNIAEIEDATRGTGWPATPTATTRGVPLVYRPTGARTYEILLPGEDRQPGTADDLVIPETVPEDLPKGMEPKVFRVWWTARQMGGLRSRVPEALRHHLPQEPKNEPAP